MSGSNNEARPFPALQLLILCATILVFLGVLGEIALRLGDLRTSNAADLQCAGSASILQSQKGLFQLDAQSGFAMRPNLCVRLQSNEYNQVLRTNSRGFVGPEIPALKPAGEFRIVVLGDSYTAGGQVPHSQNYTALVEDQLHASGYTNVRVINAGIGGCGTYCQAGVLRENISWMQPDLVVVSVFVGNNIVENVLTVHGGYRDAPEHPKGVTWGPAAGELLDQSGAWFARNGLPPTADIPPPWDPTQPLPTPVGNAPAGTPPYTSPATASASTSLWASARLAAHAVWDGARTRSLLLGRLFGKPIDPSVTTAPGSLPPSVELKRLNVSSFEWTILRDPPRTYWLDAAWPLFGSYIADIRATAASAGAPTLLMVIPQMGQFDDQTRARTMADFRFREDEVDWDRPQREVQAQTAGVPMLDLLPAFRARADRAQLYLREDTHFAALGHQAAAEQLVAFLQSGDWLQRRAP